MSTCVRLLHRVEKKVVPYKGVLSGVTVTRHGNRIRVENRTDNDIRVNGGRRPVKPRHYAVVHNGATIEIPGGVSVIARL